MSRSANAPARVRDHGTLFRRRAERGYLRRFGPARAMRHRGWRRLVSKRLGAVLTLCAAALTLVGCTTTINGRATPNPAAVLEHTPLPASQAFGDMTTIDYCSMLDWGALAKAGVTNVREPVSSYDDCYLQGWLQHQKIDVELGHLDRDRATERVAESSATLPRGLVAKRDVAGSSDSCRRWLSFPDGIDLAIVSYFDLPPQDAAVSTEALCKLDSALLDGVVTVLRQNKVTHLTFAPGSLGTVDPCTVISNAMVQEQVGLPLRPEESPSKHRCWWSAGGPIARVTVWFYIDPLHPAVEGTIGTGASRVVAAGLGRCVVDTTVGPAQGAKNDAAAVAEISVELNLGGKDACSAAQALTHQAQLPS